MSFTSLLYMVPLSFSMSLTIVVGVEAGARRFGEALRYSLLGIACNLTVAVALTIFVLCRAVHIRTCDYQPDRCLFVLRHVLSGYGRHRRADTGYSARV